MWRSWHEGLRVDNNSCIVRRLYDIHQQNTNYEFNTDKHPGIRMVSHSYHRSGINDYAGNDPGYVRTQLWASALASENDWATGGYHWSH